MNYQVDIIIIGDSKAGHEALDKIASAKPTAKLAFISQAFKKSTTHDYLNVEYFRDEVTFTDYKNRLFGCYLKNGNRIYGTHLIIASGLTYAPLMLNNKPAVDVFNTTDEIPRAAKNQPAVVICNDNADVKFALDVAKKYKQVYLCTKDATIKDLTEANKNKLAETENLVVLGNTTLFRAITKDGTLQKVELTNYATLNCNAIFVKTETTPATEFVSEKLIEKSEQGYLVPAENAESTLVPKCFAIGNCVQKQAKKATQLTVDAILNDF